MAKESEFDSVAFRKRAIQPSKAGTAYPELHRLIAPHLESFNSLLFMNGGKGILDMALAHLDPVEMVDSHGNKLSFGIESVQIAKPSLQSTSSMALERRVFPSECRERGITYDGAMKCQIKYSINGVEGTIENKALGNVPIMIKSNLCHLETLSPAEMVKKHEEAEEWGGYFIINGIERLIRLLIVTRRNHPLAIVRPSFQKRGPTYSPYGVTIRSVRDDQTSQTISIHYLTDGNVTFRFSHRKQEYMIPLVMVLKALIPTTDKEIYESIVLEDKSNTFVTDRVELMLREFKNFALYTREECLAFLGSKFRPALRQSPAKTDVEVGEYLLKKIVLVHLKTNREKFDLLIFMLQKLYALVSGSCAPDNPDSPQNHEVLLGGFLIGAIIKEKLEDFLDTIGLALNIDMRKNKELDFTDKKNFMKAVRSAGSNVGRALEYFMATGNIVSNTGLDLQQASGYTIVAEKLNFYRYISHFRSIHRGSFFAELKTTAVRKLLPESWGFLCPVHTPDGSPCGLLNHLSHHCKIMTHPLDVSAVPKVLVSYGMQPMIPGASNGVLGKSMVRVLLDGTIIGYCSPHLAYQLSLQLRELKVMGSKEVPLELEIGYVPLSHGGQFPGLYLFSQPSRFVRPVKHLALGKKDMVGSFEQIYLDIACLEDDIQIGVTTHQEFYPTNMLSVIANLTPFSDFNQSPRNMYQCQMGKQSMGSPAHAYPYRTDNKMYRLMTPQTPVVRPYLNDDYGVDNYPNGMNAVVAVISYTGYDMEDAMIINKSAYERGFGHGLIYKCEFIDLSEKRKRGEPVSDFFGCPDVEKHGKGVLDRDGFPKIGVLLTSGTPYYSYVNETTGECTVVKYKGLEDAYVEHVGVIGADGGDQPVQKISIKLRIPRNPIIGDKFSSRHGQKGVCSQKYPVVDLPFTETGVVPDVIINPHAFPSRMTIGMFVESMAGKAGALHGICADATPFQFSEEHTAVDFFGKQLKKAGYNYYGNEVMYSGIDGCEMKVDIYIGIVFYQRLRHMVSDKYQVRTTGPVDNLTRQPVKGRKRAGGIRFGEMERDSLLAHGASFCLQDRLMNCSDYSIAHLCTRCRSILSTMADTSSLSSSRKQTAVTCHSCKKNDMIDVVAIPYVFRYLASELMAMNIQMKLKVSDK